jgi:hypothetical protein
MSDAGEMDDSGHVLEQGAPLDGLRQIRDGNYLDGLGEHVGRLPHGGADRFALRGKFVDQRPPDEP